MTDNAELFRGFVCGAIAGWAQVFVMQPFQIIKVRLVNQSLHNPEYQGIRHCFSRILKEEGARAFYKGTLSPLIGYGVQGAMAFGANQLIKDVITFLDPQKQTQTSGIMPMSHVLLSGALTGMVSAAVLTPADHIRILLQKQSNTKIKYNGSIHAGKEVLKQHGARGLYLGFHSTLLREVTANAVYFYSYEFIMRFFAGGQSSAQAPIHAAFLAGGIAGSSSWLFTYPVDYIKTVTQSQDLKALKYRNMFHCARKQYQLEGYKAFFKGLGVTMLRSFPVNGVAFFSYEYFMRFMGWKKA